MPLPPKARSAARAAASVVPPMRQRALAGWVRPVLLPGGVVSMPDEERGFGAQPAAKTKPAKTHVTDASHGDV